MAYEMDIPKYLISKNFKLDNKLLSGYAWLELDIVLCDPSSVKHNRNVNIRVHERLCRTKLVSADDLFITGDRGIVETMLINSKSYLNKIDAIHDYVALFTTKR